MSPPNPFAKSASRPGAGTITVATLPPGTTVLQELSYQYPLKLIAPAPLTLPRATTTHDPTRAHTVPTVFMLTYGGGLLPADAVSLRATLAPHTRLALLTQGSTKIFKADGADAGGDGRGPARQSVRATLAPGAALVALPDPVQPFAASALEQRMEYVLADGGGDGDGAAAAAAHGSSRRASLCVLDWVSAGRAARGEAWALRGYASRSEVWREEAAGAAQGPRRRLLLRDAVILQADGAGASAGAGAGGEPRIADRVDGVGAFGTLIVGGPMFAALGAFFVSEFGLLPRIGAKEWDGDGGGAPTDEERWRAGRVEREARDGVLWTAARTRGFVVVKFSAAHVEGGKRWLDGMLRAEGTVEREFHDRALLCLR